MLESSNTDQEMVSILFKSIAPLDPKYGSAGENEYSVGQQQSNIAMVLALFGGSIGMMVAIAVTMVVLIETIFALTPLTISLMVAGHLLSVTVGAMTGNAIGAMIHSFLLTKNLRKTQQHSTIAR